MKHYYQESRIPCPYCGKKALSHPRSTTHASWSHIECYECGHVFTRRILWKKVVWRLPLGIAFLAVATYIVHNIFDTAPYLKSLSPPARFMFQVWIFSFWFGLTFLLLFMKTSVLVPVQELQQPRFRQIIAFGCLFFFISIFLIFLSQWLFFLYYAR